MSLALILAVAGTIGLSGCVGTTGAQLSDPATEPRLTANPNNVNFGNVAVGSSLAQSIALTNSGTANLTVSQAVVSGSGFSISGLSTPLRLPPGQSSSFTVRFAPQTIGNTTGAISLVSNASGGSPATVPLAGNGTAAPTLQLSLSPPSIAFGNVTVGSSGTQTATLGNTGNGSVIVSQANTSGTGFSLSGLSLPLTLAAGQMTTFQVVFAPAAAGGVSGSITILSNASNSPTSTLSGTGVPPATGQLTVNPSSVDFGQILLGSNSSRTITLTSSGSASVTISQATVSGSGFSVSGLSTPLTLPSGQSSSFTVRFAPQAAGSVTGTVSLVSNASGSPTSIPLAGSGAAPTLQLSLNPTSIAFGNVTMGNSSARTVTLSNTGSGSVTVSQANVSGTGFNINGLSLPLTLAASQAATFQVVFAPAAAGGVSGSITILSNASNSPTSTLSGTGVPPATGQLTANPSSVDFGQILLGSNSSRTITLTSSGSASVTISQATVSGSGFSVSGLSTPLTLPPGQSSSFTVGFAPQAAGSVTGSVSLVSDAPSSPTIALTGTGLVATLLLSASPTSLSFGDVATGSSGTRTVMLTNSGNSDVTVSQINVSNAAFSATGLTPPMTLTAGQTTAFTVVFAPSTSGGVSGNVTVTSNATNSPATISLSGTGVPPVAHSVDLAWNPSTSVVVGYNVYRSTVSGGPYTKLNSSPLSVTTYTDSTVQAGQTYFYMVTAVDSSGVESVPSNEVPATIPTP